MVFKPSKTMSPVKFIKHNSWIRTIALQSCNWNARHARLKYKTNIWNKSRAGWMDQIQMWAHDLYIRMYKLVYIICSCSRQCAYWNTATGDWWTQVYLVVLVTVVHFEFEFRFGFGFGKLSWICNCVCHQSYTW